MKERKGVVFTLIGATLWGFSGACSQYIFSTQKVDPSWVTVVRMLVAGGILSIVTVFKNRRSYSAIFRWKKNFLTLAAFSVFGVMLCQYTYLEAIRSTNAGTATILQYLGPVFVLVFVCLTERRLPHNKEAAAIGFAVIGTFLIATHGNPSSLVLSEEGLFWGISSAIGLMTYTLIPKKLLMEYGSAPVIGSGMLLSGIIMFPLVGFCEIEVEIDIAGVFALAGIVLLGTLLSFSLYMEGIRLIGPVKASMIASFEPVAATLISFLWLGTAFEPIDIVGFLFIIVTVVLLGKGKKYEK